MISKESNAARRKELRRLGSNIPRPLPAQLEGKVNVTAMERACIMNISELYPFIAKRKSVRSFSQEPVEQVVMDELVDFLSGQEMPVPEIDWDFDTLPYTDMVSIGAREPGVKAPHYLVLRAEKVYYSLQNSGYLGALASLWLSWKGLGACWQGNVTVMEDFPGVLTYVAAVAFGVPSEEPLRNGPSDFDRNPLGKMTLGDFDGDMGQIAEAVRLAPSSMNRQPVSLMSVDKKLHVFRRHVLLNNPAIAYPQCIDAGVAMGHIAVAAAAQGRETRFSPLKPAPKWGNRVYQLTAEFK